MARAASDVLTLGQLVTLFMFQTPNRSLVSRLNHHRPALRAWLLEQPLLE